MIKISNKYRPDINKFNIFLFSTVFLLAFIIYEKKPFKKDVYDINYCRYFKSINYELGSLVEDKNNSVIATPWSYGYQAILYSGIPTFLDGGAPTSPRHYFLNRAFLAPTQEETSKILKYLAAGNVEKLDNDIDTFQKLSKDIYNAEDPNVDIYIVITNQMRLWLHEMSAVAYYDIENDKPIEIDGNLAANALAIQNIICDPLDPKTLITNCYDPYLNEDKMEVNLI